MLIGWTWKIFINFEQSLCYTTNSIKVEFKKEFSKWLLNISLNNFVLRPRKRSNISRKINQKLTTFTELLVPYNVKKSRKIFYPPKENTRKKGLPSCIVNIIIIIIIINTHNRTKLHSRNQATTSKFGFQEPFLIFSP